MYIYLSRNIKISVISLVTLIIFIIHTPKTCVCAISAAVLHEIGHIVCTRICGVKIHGFTAGICGADIKIGACPYKTDIIVFSGGILLNAIAYILFSGTPFGIQNALYAILNALPLRCLDGGRILFCIFAHFFNIKISEKICTAISVFTFFPMWLFSIFILFKTSGNFTLFLFCMYLFALPEANEEAVI